MLVAWREDSEKQKMTEDDMVTALLEALKDVERLDVYETVRSYAGKDFKLIWLICNRFHDLRCLSIFGFSSQHGSKP